MKIFTIYFLHFIKQVSTHYVLVAFPLLLLSIPACNESPPPATNPPLAIRTVEARSGPIREHIDYVGTVRSQREVPVLARIAGTLLELPIQEGDAVKQGTVVARLTAPENHARVQQVAAEQQRTATERQYLCSRFDTDQKLADAGAIHPAQLDLSRKSCASSQAGESAARAAHAEVRSLAAKATESAPLDGYVLQWFAEPGEHVLPGKPLLLLGDQALEVRVSVAELDLERGIHRGSSVELQRGNLPPITSRISSVAPMATGSGRTIEVRIPIPLEALPQFSHGQSVDVSFIVSERENATAVPMEAVHREGEKRIIFIVQEEGVKRREVELGPRERSWVAITPTLAAGTRVAVTGLSQLEDGMHVYAVSSEGSAR